MDRAYVSLASDPCSGSSCDCMTSNYPLTIINPLFIKLLAKVSQDPSTSLPYISLINAIQETPFSILSHYANDVFSTIKTLIEEDFPDAVRAHLVSVAFQEIYIFRLQMQIGKFLNTSYHSLLSTYTQTQMVSIIDSYNSSFVQPSSCGLAVYGISSCPFLELSAIIKNRKNQNTFNGTVYYPSVKPLLDSSYNISFLNQDFGLPQWIALLYYRGYADLGFDGGYSTIYGSGLQDLYNNVTLSLSQYSFSSSSTISPSSAGALVGSAMVVDATIQYLADSFLLPYLSICKSLVYEEFNSYPSTVPCDPIGRRCVWTWGYVRAIDPGQANHNLSTSMIFSLIDQLSKVDSNPNNIQYDGNTIAIYNSYSFCSAYNNSYAYDTSNNMCFATNLSYAVSDAMVGNPSGLWGIDHGGISGLNQTYLSQQFNAQSYNTRLFYFQFACNISSLMHRHYRSVTNFHDHYVVSYLNKNKDPNLAHSFSLSRSTVWEEVGWAQWGGGYITDAIIGVRAVYQIRRDGMWYFCRYDYYTNLIEYSSWAIISGFPNAYINDVFAVAEILSYLADSSNDGINFRSFLSYISSTYIGNSANYIRGVGAVGDKTFIAESNTGNFSCPGEVYSTACNSLNTFHISSAYQCDQVQSLFTTCRTLFFQNNKFVTNCDRFETSLTARLNGIVCDHQQVYGHPHNYTKSVGNIVHAMVYGLTRSLHLTEGLWCISSDSCNYELGGMFTTVTPSQLLFEGFTDPSVLGYLNRKHSRYLHFSCVTSPYDVCGDESLQCDDAGFTLTTYHSITGSVVEEYLFRYNVTDYSLYFAESLMISYDGKLSWNTTAIGSRNQSSVVVMNPIWAAYPAWKLAEVETNSLNLYSPSASSHQQEQVAFLKDIQCQQRIYSGKAHLFSSCINTLFTGRNRFNQTLEAKIFHGNDSIQHFSAYANQTMYVNGSVDIGSRIQYAAGLWLGFQSYPYLYQGSATGKLYNHLTDIRFFDNHHVLSFDLSQSELIYGYQRDITLSYPLPTIFSNLSSSTTADSLAVRRFTETVETWNNLHTFGSPRDSYGMPYTIPIGMASIERLADMPLYIGTPHAYGNELWGGTEYAHVTGYEPDRQAQYMFADYDPVTGHSMRQGIRQQIHVRVEANVLFPLIFQSQSRCVPPTRLFSAGTGYGCFSYIPLLWMEDATVMSQEEFARWNDHYYTRPQRAYAIMAIGVAIGIVCIIMGTCLFLNETYQRRKFKNRVYVD
jgi:hypothetical protein